MLEMASLFASASIPKSLFGVLVDDPGEARDRKRLADVSAALHRLCLIDAGDGTISVHPLVQQTVREALGEQLTDVAACALDAVASAFPADDAPPAEWEWSQQLVPHIAALAESAGARGGGLELVRLLSRACRYLNRAEQGRRAVSVAALAAERAEQVLGRDDRETLHARNNYALALKWAGRISDALEIQEPLVIACAESLGDDHEETIVARNNLGALYRLDGRVEDAIAWQEPLVVEAEVALGRDHPAAIDARVNLAASYWSADRPEHAISLEEAVVEDRVRLLGAGHPDTLSALLYLSMSYADAGRVEEAVALSERVLERSVATLGEQHPSTIRVRSNLSYFYRQAGRFADAVALGERVFADRVEVLGRDHPDTLTAELTLAQARRALGTTGRGG